MNFRLTTVLWLFALFGSALALFGVSGFAVGALVLLGWSGCLQLPPFRHWEWFTIGLILLTLAALLLPAVQVGRPSSPVNRSMNHVKQWTLGMHNYHDDHGSFPPPWSSSKRGETLHGWRTLLLPYAEYKLLHASLKLHEPWDSAANQRLMSGLEIEVFKTPRRLPGESAPEETHYLAVVDDEAVFSPSGPVRMSDVTDGLENTIVLVEAAGRGVKWYEPRDLTMEEAVDLLCGEFDESAEWIVPGFYTSARIRGDGLRRRCVGFADGYTWCYAPLASRSDARALLTRAGGEVIDPENLAQKNPAPPIVIGYIVHWGRVWGTAVFLALTVAPLVWGRKIVDSDELSGSNVAPSGEA